MSEQNILEVFQGAAKSLCNLVFNQSLEGILCLERSRRVIFFNKAAETLTGYEGEEVLGKSCPDDTAFYVNKEGKNVCVEACPVEKTFKDGAIRILDVYVVNKEGFRVPVSLRIIPVFKEDGEILGAVESFSDIAPKVTIPFNHAELERMDLIDNDTGIANKTYLEMTLNKRMEEFQKYNLPFALIYVDVDGYQKILEKYGRFNSAKILRTVARTLHSNIRYFDIVGRWNTEEFLVVLLNIDENRLDIVANKLRLLIAESYITVETGMLNATVSMGATVVQRYDSVEALVKRAEQLMLHSKWLGRNTVSLSFVNKTIE